MGAFSSRALRRGGVLTLALLLVASCEPGALGTPAQPAPTATQEARPAPQQAQAGLGQPSRAGVTGQGAAPQQARDAARGGSAQAQAQPAAPVASSRTTVPARVGTIIETVKVVGRLAPSQEAGLYFRSRGRLQTIYVESGQTVEEGQLLADLDAAQLAVDLQKARSAVEQTQLKLDQSRAKPVTDDSEVDRLAVATAEKSLEQAQIALDEVRAKPLESDVKGVEAQVIAAASNLDKAKADLASRQAELAAKQGELDAKLAGPPATDVDAARATLQSEQLQLQKLREGPRPEDVRSAELALDQARLRLTQLREAPKTTPQDVQAARIAVEQAMVNLEKVLAQSLEKGADPVQSDAAVKSARIALESAQNSYRRQVSAQPTPWELRQAELAVEAAENALAKVKAVDASVVQLQELKVQQAQAKLDDLLAGPTEQELGQLRQQVDSLRAAVENAQASIAPAEAALAAARAKQDLIMRGPTPEELQAAEGKVRLADRALQAARERLDTKLASLREARAQREFDLKVLESNVENARQEVIKQEGLFGDAQIVAPFRGKVTRIRNKPGDEVNAFAVVIDLQNPERPLVRAEVPEQQFPKLTVGQRADVTLDSFPGQVLRGEVLQAPSVTINQSGRVVDKVVKIGVNWTRPGAEVGQTARVQIVVEKKDDVLIIPLQALRTVGKRTFVEFMDGNVKRSRNVVTGIASDTEVEIVSGVQEGMAVVLTQ